MNRLPYNELVVKLMPMMCAAIAAYEETGSVEGLDECEHYLQTCGWTQEEFDTEMLSRVDIDWIRELRSSN